MPASSVERWLKPAGTRHGYGVARVGKSDTGPDPWDPRGKTRGFAQTRELP